MTGTAKTEESEFRDIYHLDVVTIPTNLPSRRTDENDQVYSTIAGKLRAVVADITDCYQRGEPVLVGTTTVEKSEELSRMLHKLRFRTTSSTPRTTKKKRKSSLRQVNSAPSPSRPTWRAAAPILCWAATQSTLQSSACATSA